jgi:23S rRNA pseudouridine1911/1915/1917 synthase
MQWPMRIMESPEAYTLEVATSEAGTRLDKYLAAHLPELSRTQLQRLIQAGHVRLSQGVPTARYRVLGGRGHLCVPPPQPARPVAEAFPTSCMKMTVVVINKPPGMVVHPTEPPPGTLVNALLFHSDAFRCRGARPGVHRLDKGRPGCS